jgi:hypothetical protein
MENDSIRASGSHTLIDLWVEGRLRAVTVTREAIESFLGTKAPATMSDEDRCEFVRTHLPQVLAAAQKRLRGNGDSDSVTIEAGQLVSAGERKGGDRRSRATPTDKLPHGERRRSPRRSSDRR